MDRQVLVRGVVAVRLTAGGRVPHPFHSFIVKWVGIHEPHAAQAPRGPHGHGVPSERSLFAGVDRQVLVRGVVGACLTAGGSVPHPFHSFIVKWAGIHAPPAAGAPNPAQTDYTVPNMRSVKICGQNPARVPVIPARHAAAVTTCAPPTADDATPLHFTGKERDAETGEANGNDYFGARYYASAAGRFLIPDWAAKLEGSDPVPYAKLDNPQSLNLYAYVLNNPFSHVDADGHQNGQPNTCAKGDQPCIDKAHAQQQNGDPTLPTAEAPPLLDNQDIAGLKTATQFAVMVGIPDLGEIGAAELLGKAGSYADLTALAEKGDAIVAHHMPQAG